MGFIDGLANGVGGIQNWIFGGDASKNLDPNLKGYDQASAQLGQIAADAPGRQAPTIPNTQRGAAYQLSPDQMNQSRAGMMGTANQLGQIASGQQAGAGELAVNRQVGSATAAQAAAAHMARGANAALAYRNAARNTMDIGLAGAGQAAQAQTSDQQGANAQLGQLYGSMYGQDANVATQNAQLGQAAMLQQGQMDSRVAYDNQQAQLQQTALNDQARIQALGQQLGWDQATIDAKMKAAGVKVADKGILSGIFSGAGAALAAA